MNPEDIRQLVRGRIGQAEESLADAKALLRSGGSGRSIVNRAYYCMFYCVLALLQAINRVPQKHQGAISLFDLEFVHKGLLPRDLSADLHRMFETRQLSDYKKLEPVGLEEANAAIGAAERFLAEVRRYLAAAGHLPRG
jgi:uncharacterized protein (UPF0332 family)